MSFQNLQQTFRVLFIDLKFRSFKKKTPRQEAGVFSILPTVEDTSQGIGQNQEAASELSNMAADLKKLVGQFKYS